MNPKHILQRINDAYEHWNSYDPPATPDNIKRVVRCVAELYSKHDILCDKEQLIMKVSCKFKRPVSWDRIRPCMYDLRKAGEFDYVYVIGNDDNVKMRFTVKDYKYLQTP